MENITPEISMRIEQAIMESDPRDVSKINLGRFNIPLIYSEDDCKRRCASNFTLDLITECYEGEELAECLEACDVGKYECLQHGLEKIGRAYFIAHMKEHGATNYYYCHHCALLESRETKTDSVVSCASCLGVMEPIPPNEVHLFTGEDSPELSMEPGDYFAPWMINDDNWDDALYTILWSDVDLAMLADKELVQDGTDTNTTTLYAQDILFTAREFAGDWHVLNTLGIQLFHDTDTPISEETWNAIFNAVTTLFGVTMKGN